MLSWSASFYPQPITNFRRKSTAGVSIDFTIINFLGFLCYTIYTATFLYSPTIRAQYAARYPTSEEPTVRFNDLAFAVHAVLLCALMYTQFWPSIWAFHVPRFQRISKTMAGFFWGCVLAPLVVVWIVLARSPDKGYDASSWAWIDVVSETTIPGAVCPVCPGLETKCSLDLCVLVRQGPCYRFQVCTSGVVELQATVDGGLEYSHDPSGSERWHSIPHPAGARFESPE